MKTQGCTWTFALAFLCMWQRRLIREKEKHKQERNKRTYEHKKRSMDSNVDQEEEAKSACSESLNSNKTSDSGIKIDDFSPSSVSDEISAEATGAVVATAVTEADAAAGQAVADKAVTAAANNEYSKEDGGGGGDEGASCSSSNSKISTSKTSAKNVAEAAAATSASMEIEEAGRADTKEVSSSSSGIVAAKRRHPNRVYRNRMRIDSSSSSTSTCSHKSGDDDVPERIPKLRANTPTGGAEGDESNSQNTNEPQEREREGNGDGNANDSDADNSNSNMEVAGARIRVGNIYHGDDSELSTSSSQSSDDDDDDNDDVDDENMPHYNDANPGPDSEALKELMAKAKPSYAWSAIHELMRRENGFDRNGRSLANGLSHGFQTRFYASRHVVERMKLSHCLRRHNGCVNSLNFNKTGDLLCSGSDDTRIIIWDWARNKTKHVFKSGHTENIFQTKFLDCIGCLDIISASRDGQVRRSVIPASGGAPQTSCIYKHIGGVHKLVVSPQSSSEVISVGEDALIRSKDLRCDNKANEMRKMVTGKKKGHKVRLYSISHHPYAPEICVCGSDCYVRVYDKRNLKQTVHEMCPDKLTNLTMTQITCCVYDTTGNEILASYSDDNIYLFNNRAYKSGEFMHSYAGHYNHRTIKGVNFFGPHSEYVISGSDCGNIFYWDKGTEAILNFMNGDSAGVVNCLEPHPKIPILATSGLDHNIKMWTPHSEIYPPDQNDDLEKCVKRNLQRSVIEEGNEFDDQQFRFFMRRFMRRSRTRGSRGRERGDAGNFSSNSDDNDDNDDLLSFHFSRSSESSESSADVDEYPQLEGIQCRTQ